MAVALILAWRVTNRQLKIKHQEADKQQPNQSSEEVVHSAMSDALKR